MPLANYLLKGVLSMKKIDKRLFLFLIPIVMLGMLFVMPDRKVKNEIIYNENYQDTEIIKVYVFGEVKNPGYYYLNEDSTYADLLNKCGLTDYSDVSSLDQSIILQNNHSYEISIVKDESNKSEVNIEQSTINPTPEESLININTATLTTLITLPSIGTSRATAIIEYRSNNKFTKVDDILKVEGISEGIYEKIKNLITV